MNRQLSFSGTVYGLGVGVFFLGYCLFEVPSNLALARVGARRWIARIMISWGALASAMMFVRGPTSFYVLRFLLGVAEAGLFPGLIYYLGDWFPSRERARAIGRFMTALPVSVVVGGPLSSALLGLTGRLGLAGWQWLFLLEGIPTVILGLVVLVYLTDRPEMARWLAPEERSWLAATLRAECERCHERHGIGVRRTFSHGTVWQLGLLECLSLTAVTYALSFWLPQIVRALLGLSDQLVGVVVALPYLVAAAVMVAVGAHSDRTGERCLPIAVGSIAAALGLIVAAYTRSPVLALTALTVAAAGTAGNTGPFFALPAEFLTGEAAAAGIALVNSTGNLMGFATPYAIGILKDATGGYSVGLLLLGLLPLAGAALALHIRRAPVLMSGPQPLTSP